MSAITPVYCSFCGKPNDQVETVISGPRVFICDECVDLCNSIIAERRGQPARAMIGYRRGEFGAESMMRNRRLRAVKGPRW